MKFQRILSNRLYPNNGFFVGIGSILDLSANYFRPNFSSSSEKADYYALKHDFKVIGKDFHNVISKEVEKELLDEIGTK